MPHSPDRAPRTAALALALMPGVGIARYHALRSRFANATEALRDAGDARTRVAAIVAAERMLGDVDAIPGCFVLTSDDDGYPSTLADLPDPPPYLFGLGRLEVLHVPTVAMVGTRRATRYGERVARELAESLARSGACVASGMARGIDAAAHRGALAVGGATVAVLGTGIDVAYPSSHRSLHAEIAANGLVLSEFPPGERATAGSFPRRNRLIAALAAVTVVIEAGYRSGALITAGHALDLGRTVAAVPGPIDVPQNAGSNELLRDGAAVIASTADLLALAGVTRTAASPRRPLTADENEVWQALGAGAGDLDTLAARTRLPAQRCLAAVSTLEIDGAIECALTGEVRRR